MDKHADKHAAEHAPDWTIEDLYRQSFRIVKTHKVLWVFGMAIASAAANFNLRSPEFDPETISNIEQLWHKSTTDGSSSVLGSSTAVMWESISYLFSSIPSWFYLLLVIELLLAAIIALIIGTIYQNWATGALLVGIQNVIHKRAVSIRESSEKAFLHIVPLIQVTVIPGFLLLFAFVGVLFLLGVGFAASGSFLRVVFGTLLGISILAFLIAWVLLVFSLVWAVREIVMSKKPWKVALQRGYFLARKKFWMMLLLGFVNNLLIGLIVALPIGLIFGVFVGGFFTYSFYAELGIGLFVIGGMLLTLFILACVIFGGIINTFKASVWSLAYQTIHKKYDTRS